MEETSKAGTFKKIEEWKEELKVPDAVLEGVKAANGWKTGRQVEKESFQKAVRLFLQAPIDGSAIDEEAKG